MLKSSWTRALHGRTRLTLQNSGNLAYITTQVECSSIKISVHIDGHLVPGVGERVVNRLDEICDRSASEPVMAASHKEGYMSESMPEQGVKIYTADG